MRQGMILTLIQPSFINYAVSLLMAKVGKFRVSQTMFMGSKCQNTDLVPINPTFSGNFLIS